MVIPVQIRNRRAAAEPDCPAIVCGNSDYEVLFDFDSEWDAFAQKTARFAFRRDGHEYAYTVVFSGDRCAVPVLSGINLVTIGVSAGSVTTSAPARIPCMAGISDLHGRAVHPEPDVYDVLMQKLAQMRGGFRDSCCLIADSGGDLIASLDGEIIACKEC